MDLIEVERKRELPEGNTLRQWLAELGYRGGDTLEETDIYYTRPDVDYMETVECLRIRRRDGFAEITYKPRSNASTHSDGHVIAKPETNVHIGADQAEAAAALLDAIGMVELVRVVKCRATFRHAVRDDIVVSIDTVAGAGEFVETEVMGTDSTAARVDLEVVERALGIDEYPVVRLPYRDLVMAHISPAGSFSARTSPASSGTATKRDNLSWPRALGAST